MSEPTDEHMKEAHDLGQAVIGAAEVGMTYDEICEVIRLTLKAWYGGKHGTY